MAHMSTKKVDDIPVVTTVWLPRPIYNKVKAQSTLTGVPMRRLFVDAMDTYLDTLKVTP